jgi:hypothetical protein
MPYVTNRISPLVENDLGEDAGGKITAVTGGGTVVGMSQRDYNYLKPYGLVSEPAPTISTASPLTAGQEGVAYSQTIEATGGAAPYTYAVTAGALPTDVSLSSGGALSGTPSVNGAFAFTVTATAANGLTGSKAFALTIDPP